MRKAFLLAILGVTIATPVDFLLGCRYNVRETGFVDLGMGSFLFLCYTDSGTPATFQSDFESAAEKIFADTNVIQELVNTESQTDHPALKFLDREGNPSIPAVVILSPQGGSDLALESEGKSIESLMTSVVDSPLRNEIVRHLSRVYGVVLLIEGKNPSDNARVKGLAKSAMSEIESQMKFMPKPISHGPVLVTVSQDQLADEKVLLWSMGLTEEDLSEPHVAILYGRGRWIGPLLRGEEIQEQILFNILSVIGADCECGLDPRLIRGTALPIRWNQERRDEVASDLGFDPDNPMVKIEVSQILKLRGALYPMASAPTRTSIDDLPVPFVEDRESSPLMKNVLLALGSLVGLVLIVGLMMLRRAKRTVL
jgi:hypothetical protein